MLLPRSFKSILFDTYRDLQGVIVTVDEVGYLHCAYLGTDPSMMVTPAPEARDINYEVSSCRNPKANISSLIFHSKYIFCLPGGRR